MNTYFVDSRRGCWALAVALMWLLAISFSVATQAAEEPFATPTADLASAIASGRIPKSVVEVASQKGEVPVLVELKLVSPYQAEHLLGAGADGQRLAIAKAQDEVAAAVLGIVPKPPQRMRYVPYMAMWGDARTLTALVQAKAVRRVQANVLAAPSLDMSTATQGSLAVQRALGPTAAGQTIAIIDTGVESGHPFFGGRVVSQACYSDAGGWFSSTESNCPNQDDESLAWGSAEPCSYARCDHGTHVAGIAAGRAFPGVTFSGVANAANVIAIQVFHREDDVGTCALSGSVAPCPLALTSDVVLGLERVYALRQQFDIAAVNMSLGGGFYNDRATCDSDGSAYRAAVDNLIGANIATVAAAGNGAAIRDALGQIIGFNTGIGLPACVSNVISVGSVNNSDQLVASSQFSSLLTMLAVGASVNSSVPGGGFAPKGGTSMAAPHVAGAITTLAARYPNLTVAQLRDLLITSGRPVTDTRMANLVKARLQLDAAIETQDLRPLPPSALTASSVTGSTATVTWVDNARSETSFDIIANGRATTIPNANVQQGTATRLAPNVTYSVSVVACDGLRRCSVPSPSINVTTLNTIPTPPSNLRVGVVTTTSIEIRWDSQSVNPVTHFFVGDDTSGNWRSTQVAATTRSMTFTNLTPNTSYSFWVAAGNSDINVGTQVTLQARTLSLSTAPAAPTNLHLCTGQSLELQCLGWGGLLATWTDNARNETRFEFEYGRVTVNPALQGYITRTLAANTRRIAIDGLSGLGLQSGAPYYFRVRACNVAGCSNYSNRLSYTAP